MTLRPLTPEQLAIQQALACLVPARDALNLQISALAALLPHHSAKETREEGRAAAKRIAERHKQAKAKQREAKP